jgi:hypothetical protein
MGIKLCNKLQNKIMGIEKWRNLKESWDPNQLQHTFYSADECI